MTTLYLVPVDLRSNGRALRDSREVRGRAEDRVVPPWLCGTRSLDIVINTPSIKAQLGFPKSEKPSRCVENYAIPLMVFLTFL